MLNIEQKLVKNPDWWEADQLAIILHSIEELNLGPSNRNPSSCRQRI